MGSARILFEHEINQLNRNHPQLGLLVLGLVALPCARSFKSKGFKGGHSLSPGGGAVIVDRVGEGEATGDVIYGYYPPPYGYYPAYGYYPSYPYYPGYGQAGYGQVGYGQAGYGQAGYGQAGYGGGYGSGGGYGAASLYK